jgi:diguanylate cyclase (GGDEF)-like protein
VTLGVTAIASFEGRQSLLEAQAWVTHTNEVKIELLGARLALARADRVELRAAERRIEHLTQDNVRQQRVIARASLLTEQGADGTLDALFGEMDLEEGRLMAERTARAERAQLRNRVASIIALAVTVALLLAANIIYRRQRRELARQRRLIESIVDKVDEGIIAVGTDRHTVTLNAAARAMGEDGAALARDSGPLGLALRGVITTDFVYQVQGKWISASARPVLDEDGNILAAVTTLRDVTAQRAATQRLRALSVRDEMTGLLNRRGFMERAAETLAATKDDVAVLFADMNGLKRINDELGHEHGDQAIKDMANVLRSFFRHDDVVARLGGDEFVVLLRSLCEPDGGRLLDRLTASFEKAGLSVSSGLSYGRSIDDLLVEADQRMYAQKRRQRVTTPSLRLVREA